MAQLAEKEGAGALRLRLAMRQRPMLVLAVSLVLGAVGGAALFGVAAAQSAGGGVEINRTSDNDAEPKSVDQAEKDEEVKEEVLIVDVSGAVASSGVFELSAGARVQDAIEQAGGLAGDADVGALNRAAPLADGQKVYVPRQGEVVPAAGSGTGSSTGVAGASSLVNINTADEAALDALPGVGPSTAAAIIEDRNANGPFASVEDLMRVSGIGEKKFEKLKNSICV